MNSRWFIVSPVRNSYLGLAVLSTCVRGKRAITNSNGDSASPWKIPLYIGTSRVFQHYRLAPPSRTSSFFPKQSSHILLCPRYSLSPRSGGPCHNLSDNRSIPSLSSSSVILLPEEASHLCITGPQYPFTSCILSALLVISLRFLENHRFHQQLSLSTVSMSRRDI